MDKYSTLAITIPLLLFVVTFGGLMYDNLSGRTVSFSDISGVAIALFFLFLVVLSKQRTLEDRVRALEERLK